MVTIPVSVPSAIRAASRATQRGLVMRNPNWAAVAVAAVTVFVLSGCVATASNVASAPPTSSTTSLDPALREDLDAALDEGFAASGMPGVTVGLWIPGQDEWVATRGVSDLASNQPMDRANQSKIGSITKTITSTVALQVIGDGEAGLTLDDTIDVGTPTFLKRPRSPCACS